MWLNDLFSGGQVNNSAQVQQTHAAAGETHNASQAGRQIQSLAPGQTIQGEVVSRNGSEVQIKLSEDMTLNARVDQNMQLEVGKTMTFEVRNNGQTLTLSPLFANTATDANVMKALDMAALPTSDTTVAMTALMMKAGLSIDRSSLQQMFREVNAFRGADISDLVDLHKLGLPVNEENLAQIASYKNLTHQLVEGMHTVLDALPDTMGAMQAEGNLQGAAEMFAELLDLVQELPGEAVETAATQTETVLAEEGAPTAQTAEAAQNAEEAAQTAETAQSAETAPQAAQTMAQTAGAAQTAETDSEAAVQDGQAAKTIIADSAVLRVGTAALPETAEQGVDGKQTIAEHEAAVAGEAAESASVPARGATLPMELQRVISESGSDPARYSLLLQQLNEAVQNGNTPEQAKIMQNIFRQGLEDNDQPLLRSLVSNKAAQKFLTDGLSKLWTIEPKDVADKGKVEELYQRLDRQLGSLKHILEQGGQTDGPAAKAVNNMTQNLDFLQQLNQAYTYVQLPLRLQQGEAHGDLYVYTNKRNLSAKDGQISALLHLDMEHLGPVDVYVAMQAEKVNTRFYVQDDAMLDFLEAHMDQLTARLQKRGYNCSCAMQVRGRDEEPESGLNGLIAK